MNSPGIKNIDGANTIRALEYAKRIAYSTEETLMFTYEMAKKYADAPGIYVECGTAAGAQVIAMRAGAPNKNIHVFDSFEGLPLPSNRDDQMPGIAYLTKAEQKALPDPGKQALVSTGAVSVSTEDFWKHLESAGVGRHNIVLNIGWFEHTVPEWPIGETYYPIAILRLDGDLYNSTYVCLKHLYQNLIKGGLVIIDDWQLPGCRRAVDDFIDVRYLQNNSIVLPEIQFVSNIAYWIKP